MTTGNVPSLRPAAPRAWQCDIWARYERMRDILHLLLTGRIDSTLYSIFMRPKMERML